MVKMINLLMQNNIKFFDNGNSIFRFINAFILIKIKNRCLIRKFINFILPAEIIFSAASRFYLLKAYGE
jgi:hypothetical protein